MDFWVHGASNGPSIGSGKEERSMVKSRMRKTVKITGLGRMKAVGKLKKGVQWDDH